MQDNKAVGALLGRCAYQRGNIVTIWDLKDISKFRRGVAVSAASNADGSGERFGVATVADVNLVSGTVTLDDAGRIACFADGDYLFAVSYTTEQARTIEDRHQPGENYRMPAGLESGAAMMQRAIDAGTWRGETAESTDLYQALLDAALFHAKHRSADAVAFVDAYVRLRGAP